MDRAKRSEVAGLPDDILVQILSRVSVKDLHRSKCVSKPWRGLIADPLHRKELPQTLHGLFHGGGGYGGDAGSDGEGEDSDRDGGEDGEEDEDDDDKNKASSWVIPGYGHFINLVGRSAHLVDPSFSFLKRLPLPGIDKLRLMGSCDGLLLFHGGFDLDSMGFVVCNPATEQWAAVPSCSQGRPRTYYWSLGTSQTYLVFDPALSSHFHLVMFWQEDQRPSVHAYHSKTGAWSHSDIDWTEEERERSPRDFCYLDACVAAFVNGMLYLIFEEKSDFSGDFRREDTWSLPAPSALVQGNSDYTAIFVGQSQGRLHCVNEEWGAHDIPSELASCVHIGDSYGYALLSIWVLDDNGTQQWVLKHSVSLLHNLHLFGKLGESGAEYSVVAIHHDRNLVLIVQCWNWQLISYDVDSKEVCALGTLEQECTRFTPFVPCFLDFLSN